jgi:hypothetical protein
MIESLLFANLAFGGGMLLVIAILLVLILISIDEFFLWSILLCSIMLYLLMKGYM